MTEEWKSVKIREDIYKQLKDMGIGISKAIEILLEEQRKRIEEKFQSIEQITAEIFEEMVKNGFFNITLKGFCILDVHEENEDIIISGIVAINVPNSKVRKKIVEKLKPKVGEKDG